MPVQWTPRQTAAIEARNCNLLVSAAAGSGKTAVLVERICALAREGHSIENMLVVTFTRAAAAEMREKILLAFQKEADGGGAHAAHFAEQSALVEQASISTLHGFCGDVLRTYFPAAGVDPTYRIGDDRETASLRAEALQEVIREAYEEGGADFESLAACWTDEQIGQQVAELYRFLRTQPEPWAWMERATADYRADGAALEGTPWVGSLLRAARARIASARVSVGQAIRICEQPGGCAGYVAALESDLVLLNRLNDAAGSGYEALREALDAANFQNIGRIGKNDDKNLAKQAKDLRDAAKQAVMEGLRKGLFAASLGEHAADFRAQLPSLRALGTLARALDAAYGARKQARNLLDYEDLEHKALEATRHDWVAKALRERYAWIFVDEYQDSSVIQEELVNRIAGADNVFLVGDVKQSIYRFRQAEPRLFLQKAAAYSAEEGTAHRRIDLNRNFRSRPNVLAAINHIFAHAMREEETEIPYDREAMLYPGLQPPDTDPDVELHLLDASGEAGAADDPPGDEEDGAEKVAGEPGSGPDGVPNEGAPDFSLRLGPGERLAQEAALAAERIHALVGTGALVWDAKREEHRPLRYRDIVILLRAAKNVAQQIQRALEQRGIPVFCDTGDSFFAMPEVRMVIDLLRVVDNPLNDTALLGALHGPAARLDNDALAAIRQACADPDASFYGAVQSYLQREDALAEKLRRFLVLLDSLRLCAKALPLDALVWRIYEETGCYARAGSLPGGRTRQANLHMLAERAAALQQRRGAGLPAFLWEAEQLRAQNDTLSAKALGEHEDVVRIMTMHKSKGLEFPVVICLELGRSFAQRSGARAPISCHSALGIALRRIDPELRVRYDTLACDAHKLQRERETLADATRLLYVAMTRAQDRLILIGHGNRARQPLSDRLSRWALAAKGDAGGSLLTEARSMIDLLMPPLVGGAEGTASGGQPFEKGAESARRQWREEGGRKPSEPQSARCARQWRTEGEGPNFMECPPCGHSGGDVSTGRWSIQRRSAVVLPEVERARADAWLRELNALPAPDAPSPVALGLGSPPVEPLQDAPRWKTTVSALLRKEQGEEAYVPPSPWPLFLEERFRPDLGLRGLDGAARGAAFHTAMRALSLEPLRGLRGEALREEIAGQLDGLVAGERLRQAERDSLRAEEMAAFFASELGRRMLASGTVRREWAFNLRIAAEEAGAEVQLVQGVLDCCFIPSDAADAAAKDRGWVLLDYKTDADPDTDALRERYAPQIALYAQALTRITNLPVTTAALYLVKKGTFEVYDAHELIGNANE
ncbi:MAG: UvrD-helicase domain-containing protein [Clostridia bacterium]|nr:UvrD-helicase domain-containing protein [Clostridia bacterium]